MALSVKINNVTYSAVPSVQIPLAEGVGNATFYDTSGANIGASDVLAGKTGFGASGSVTGTLAVPSISQDVTTKVLTIA